MKIAVLTLPLHANYGGLLQCYSLCSVLKGMGHEVKVINHSVHRPLSRILLSTLKRIYLKLVVDQKESIFEELRMYVRRVEIMCDIEKFQKKYIPMTSSEYTGEYEKLSPKKFDAYIVGSDQVWRSIYARENLENYFLGFLQNKNPLRISYAASFGVDYSEYSQRQIEACGKLIEKFDAVSVREESGVELISSIYKWKSKTPRVVLDPTMLQSGEDYVNTFKLTNEHQLPFITTYILDSNIDYFYALDWLVANQQLSPHHLPSPDVIFRNEATPCKKLMSPTQWLSSILHSEWVLTDSFHGCVFSILFNKPFLAFGNQTRGFSRLSHLLKTFHLENRLVTSAEDFINRKEFLLSEIDYSGVNKLLKEERERSLRFLVESLNDK